MTTQIPTLNGWRAIAIALVIVCHSLPDCNPAWLGKLGVDIFFGLSGFLITALLLEEHERTGSIDLLAFYRRRAFRILPPALVFLAVVGLSGLYKSGWELASTLLFFRNYLPVQYGTYATAHLWSLAVEEHFYLLWPGLLVLAGAPFMRRSIGHGALAIALWRLAATSYHWASLAGVGPGQRTDFQLDSLLWGCAVAFLYTDSATKSKLILRPWLWAAMAAAVLTPNFIDGASPLLIVASVATPLLIPFLLAGAALQPQWILSRFLELAALQWIGRLSYSLYLWQEIFSVDGLKSQSLPLNLALTLAAACASYYLIERPMIQLGRGSYQVAIRVRYRFC
ncbi:MAG TPA: acyltransferase [Bryobacteraceae bacterium]|nr:acyltransferase [Blastocatellia bacterium]HXJ43456.1 acyltransferase [Bryobacteraceae bacterium]